MTESSKVSCACSSFCSCALLVQLQESFVRKFKVFPNQSGNLIFANSELNDSSTQHQRRTNQHIVRRSVAVQTGVNSPSNETGNNCRKRFSSPINSFPETPTTVRRPKLLVRSPSLELVSPSTNNLAPNKHDKWRRRNDSTNKKISNQHDYKEPETSEKCHLLNDVNDNELGSEIGFKVLAECSQTPMSAFHLMSESELNNELDKYGHRPMGRQKAITLLQRIYEATHPEISTTTPMVRKISKALNLGQSNKNLVGKEKSNQAWEKRSKKAIEKILTKNDDDNSGLGGGTNVSVDRCQATNPMAGNMMDLHSEDDDDVEKIVDANKKKNMDNLRRKFVEWIRRPENAEIYCELLALNPIMLDGLLEKFGPEIARYKCSRESFKRILDCLHITFIERQKGNNAYHF